MSSRSRRLFGAVAGGFGASPGLLIADGMLNFPSSLTVGSITYIGYADTASRIWTAQVDNATGVLSGQVLLDTSPQAADDHFAVAHIVTTDSKYMPFYARHGNSSPPDNNLRWRKSTDANTANVAAQQIHDFGHNISFPHAFKFPDGTIVATAGPNNADEVVMWSTDNGANFTFGPRGLVSPSGSFAFPFSTAMPGRSKVRAFYCGDSGSSSGVTGKVTDWYSPTAALNAGRVISNGTDYGGLDGTFGGLNQLPVLDSTLAPFYTPPGGFQWAILDVHSTGRAVLIRTWDGGSNSTLVIRRLTGTNPHASASYTTNTVMSDYGDPLTSVGLAAGIFPGAVFAKEPNSGLRVYAATHNLAAGTSTLRQLDSTDDGATWSQTSIIKTIPRLLFRPGSSTAFLFWQEAAQHDALGDLESIYYTANTAGALNAADINAYIDIAQTVSDSGTLKFSIEWNGTPITTPITIAMAEGGTATGAAFTNSFDTDVTNSLATGVTYNAGTNTLTIDSTATSPFVISRPVTAIATAGGNLTYTVTISALSIGTIRENPTATAAINAAHTYGVNILLDPGFDQVTPDSWVFGTGTPDFAINNSRLNVTSRSSAGADRVAEIVGALVNGAVYRVTGDITGQNGGLTGSHTQTLTIGSSTAVLTALGVAHGTDTFPISYGPIFFTAADTKLRLNHAMDAANTAVTIRWDNLVIQRQLT